jgi:STE24 endopeptidase
MKPPGFILLTALALAFALRWVLAGRQIAFLRRQARASPAEAHAAAYASARARLDGGVATLETMLIAALTLGGGIAWLDREWAGRPLAGAVLVGTVAAALAIVRGAAWLYQSRSLDVRFGLAEKSAGPRLAAALPDRLARIAAAAAAGQALAWLIGTGWRGWWLAAALAWALGLTIEAGLQAQLTGWPRRRLRALPDDALRHRLRALLERWDLPGAEIQVRDSGGYSRRANARLAGIWRWRRIELSDTLVALLDPAEIEAVVAHEAGHWKGAHVAKDLAGRALAGTLGVAAMAAAMQAPEIGSAMRLATASAAGWLAAGAALLPLLRFFLSPLPAFWHRGFEYEADEFAAREIAPGALIAALEKLHAVNATVRASDWLYAGFYAHHPEPAQRIRHLGALDRPRGTTAAAT